MHLLRPHKRSSSATTTPAAQQTTFSQQAPQLPPIETSTSRFLGHGFNSVFSTDSRPERPNTTEDKTAASRMSGANLEQSHYGYETTTSKRPVSNQYEKSSINNGSMTSFATSSSATQNDLPAASRRITPPLLSISNNTTSKRHNAKSLLHPMSLLLRRRSSQANGILLGDNSSYHFGQSHNKYGPNRDLPDDFDPGIIYGTRHPDWSAPRNSQTFSESTLLHVKTNEKTSLDGKDRTPLFKEHFGDEEEPQDKAVAQQSSDNLALKSNAILKDKENQATPNIELTHNITIPGDVEPPSRPAPAAPQTFSEPEPFSAPRPASIISHFSSSSDEDGMRGVTLVDRPATAPIHLAENASRFSFEASSIAGSSHLDENEEDEETSPVPQLDRGYDSDDSAAFDDAMMEDLMNDEDGEDFPNPDLYEHKTNMASMGFHMNDLQLDDLDGDLEPPPGVNDNNSTLAESNSSTKSTDDLLSEYPPFVNPVGGGLDQSHQQFYAPDGSRLDDEGNTLSITNVPNALPFYNQYQSGQSGVTEYEANTFMPRQAITYEPEEDGFDDHYEDDFEGDEPDDLIAEANEEALANDSEGWYSREFDGYFEHEMPRPGYLNRHPSLTPISERSEGSFKTNRNSIQLPFSSIGHSHKTVGAGSLSAALNAELLAHNQLYLQYLQQQTNFGNSGSGNTPVDDSPTLSGDGIPDFIGRTSNPMMNDLQPGRPMEKSFFEQALDEEEEEHVHGTSSPVQYPDVTTNYVKDPQLGWFQERRQNGQLLGREPVQGIV